VKLSLTLEVQSDPRLLSVIRSAVERFAEVVGFSEEDCRAITAAVDEAVTNVIRHAYQNRHDQPIRIVFEGRDDGLEFVLTDRGLAPDPAKLRGRPLEEVRPGGLGTHIMARVMSRVEYETSAEGNRLRLFKALESKPAGGG
jgi:anti-sigma regulatory factor (Ser/Thr protein kinase)